MIKGVIIDFNGTLYLDHDLNKKAWEDAFNSVRTKGSKAKYSDLSKENCPNDYLLSRAIFRFFNIEPTDIMINDLSDKKEIEYREMAIKQNRNKLIEGVEAFLDYLKENNIPFCIASMAPKSNFDFYLSYLHLDNWFNYNNIVYDNGSYPTKNKQIIEAAKRLNIDIEDCLILEDTPINIEMAINEIGAKKFIYVNTKGISYNAKEIIQEIKDYTELNYKIFNN